MMDQGRFIYTIIFLASVVATLIVAFKTRELGLVVLCLIIQVVAFALYCITWIPGGMTFIKSMFCRG